MMKPTIHMNGTSKDELIENHLAALSALRTAQDRMAVAAPNGRDYYPQDKPGERSALYRAQEEHEARCLKIREVQKEILALIEAIDETPDWRNPR